MEEKHYLRMQLEGKVEELWKRFQQALRDYTEATEDRKIAFEVLKLKDEKSTKEIDMQMKKLQKMQVSGSSEAYWVRDGIKLIWEIQAQVYDCYYWAVPSA